MPHPPYPSLVSLPFASSGTVHVLGVFPAPSLACPLLLVLSAAAAAARDAALRLLRVHALWLPGVVALSYHLPVVVLPATVFPSALPSRRPESSCCNLTSKRKYS